MRKSLLTALTSAAVIFGLAGCEFTDNGAPNKIPKSLIGQWYQTENDIDGVEMQASVSSSSIQIDMQFRDSSEMYWMGSFSGTNSPKRRYTIKSQGDSDAMSLSLFGSQDKNKVFKYKNGVISFEFSMLGETTTVKMAKADSFSTATKTATPKPNTPSYRAPSTNRTTGPAAKAPAPAVQGPSKKR